MRTSPKTISIAVVLALVASIFASMVVNAETTPSVTPTAGPPGTTYAFTAEFETKAKVGYWVTDPDGTVYSDIEFDFTTSSKSGVYTWNWTSPGNAKPGEWKMSARQVASSVFPVIVIPFVVTGTAPEPTPTNAFVTPPSGPAGTAFTFTASGYDSDEMIDFWVTTPSGSSQAPVDSPFQADSSGVVRWTWQTPTNVEEGVWLVVARGRAERKTERQARFTVTNGGAAATPTPSGNTVVPSGGPPGTTFVITLGGFMPSEPVTYWASSPDGETLAPEENVIFSDATGRISITWTAPNNATRGTWLMVGSGRTSRVTSTIRFDVN
jgi:hypothetical protein